MISPQKKSFETLSQAMNALKQKGFNHEFDFKNANLYNHFNKAEFTANQLKIVEVHRFEGVTNPSDSSILFAIICDDGSKGLLVDAYGMYADADKTEFMSKVEILSE